jgi:hypothetical protein
VPYGVSQAKAEPAQQHQPKSEQQLHTGAQRDFSITLELGRLCLFVVEDSPHALSF